MSLREERLSGGLTYLKAHRDGKGRWHRFPFHYTLLALSEMQDVNIDDEIQYVAAGMERMLKRRGRGDRFDLRRRAVAERLLARA